ncbi:DsrE/DsrF/TusD sulfur relay family protein [Pengzhenrongella sp.]|uniref:DsrE/DsrF/TusD sulfur relay family protein n=1 Tax=Pengzhenrongella sp. TaxID=2888820 RepID=UPI002F94AE56
MERLLFVLHDPPYGSERVYNALRWAAQVVAGGNEVKVFFFGDSVAAAAAGQKVPNGYYNTGKQASALADRGVALGCCGTCMNARGLSDDRLLDGAHRSSMVELAEWTTWAGKVINV